jgi:hypothetical protein
MNFYALQTLRLNIFPVEISGMVPDSYGDLNWNPAMVLNSPRKSLYLDFNLNQGDPIEPVFEPVFYTNDAIQVVTPRWYQTTSVNPLDATPLYNLVGIIPLSPKLSLAFSNRSMLDYGPFRNTTWWTGSGWYTNTDSYDREAIDSFNPQRLEVDDNQQRVIGNQNKLMLGYTISPRLNLGLSLAYYYFKRYGELYDSKTSSYPHNSLANLNTENLDIRGNQIELNAGIIYTINNRTRVGLSFGWLQASSIEEVTSSDTTETWSERDIDPSYYSYYYYNLKSGEKFKTSGKVPSLRVNLEKDLNPTLMLRSGMSVSWSENSLEGTAKSSDTSTTDRTYDHWNSSYSQYYLQRGESQTMHDGRFDGDGKNRQLQTEAFVSLIYHNNEAWSIFTGIKLLFSGFQRNTDEHAKYESDYAQQLSRYAPETSRNYHFEEYYYQYQSDSQHWMFFLPVGFDAQIVKGFHILLGADLSLSIEDLNEDGERNYTLILDKKWENGQVIINDQQMNRQESFSSDPALEFQRHSSVYLGFYYEHSSGLRLFLKPGSDIFQSDVWSLGFEFIW